MRKGLRKLLGGLGLRLASLASTAILQQTDGLYHLKQEGITKAIVFQSFKRISEAEASPTHLNFFPKTLIDMYISKLPILKLIKT